MWLLHTPRGSYDEYPFALQSVDSLGAELTSLRRMVVDYGRDVLLLTVEECAELDTQVQRCNPSRKVHFVCTRRRQFASPHLLAHFVHTTRTLIETDGNARVPSTPKLTPRTHTCTCAHSHKSPCSLASTHLCQIKVN